MVESPGEQEQLMAVAMEIRQIPRGMGPHAPRRYVRDARYIAPSSDLSRAIVADMQAPYPAEAARIGRGLNVLLGSEIRATAELGRYLVQSCQDAGIYNQATSWSCCCPDRQRHPDLRCKHSWALELVSTASAIASYETARTRYQLTARAERAWPRCRDGPGGRERRDQPLPPTGARRDVGRAAGRVPSRRRPGPWR